MRLDKFLSVAANISRADAGTAIARGRVSVNGTVVRRAAEHIDENDASVLLDGTPVFYMQHVYYMMNKPAGVLSATEDKHCKTAVGLLDAEDKRNGLFVAGRLDKDTTGFLLITDDGEFAHNILSPKKHVVKTYRAVLRDPVGERYGEELARGVVLDGSLCKCASFERLSSFECLLGIGEGKYHQVKRMFEALGNKVEKLSRIAIGGLFLDEKLAEGEYRLLTDGELLKIIGHNTQN